jgi:predicted HTH domain antitoxin
MMSLVPLFLNLPDLLRAQLSAAQEAGHYATEEELVADAVRTFLAARPDVRIASACRLYELGVVSLIKAAELAEVDAVSLKRLLHERGITRAAPESWTETEAMARAALSAANRTA